MRNELDAREWVQRLKEADRARAHWAEAAIESDLRHKSREEDDSGRLLTYNKQYAATRTATASIRPRSVSVKLRPILPENAERAGSAEIVTNWDVRVDRISGKSRSMIYNGVVLGCGVSYTTWSNPWTPVMNRGSAVLGKPTEAKNAAEEDVGQEAIRSVFGDPMAGSHYSRTFVISPFDFLIDPQATSVGTARWAAHRIWRTKEEFQKLQAAGLYDRKLELKWQPLLSSTMKLFDRESFFRYAPATGAYSDSDPSSSDLWECWIIHDFQSDMAHHVLPGTDGLLRSRANPIGNPYDDFRPNSTPDEYWSYPDSWQYAAAQERLNQVSEAMADYTERLAKPILFVPNRASKEWILKYADASPGEAIPTPAEIIAQMKWAEVPTMPEMLRELAPALSRIVSEVSGISEVSAGLISSPAITATEANLTAGFHSVRMEEHKEEFRLWLEGISKKKLGLLQRFFTQADALPILGSPEFLEWSPANETKLSGPIKNEDIQGEYDLEVMVGESAQAASLAERKLAMDGLLAVTPFMQAGILDPRPVLAWFLRKFGVNPKEMISARPVAPMGPLQSVPAGRGAPPPAGPPGPLSPDIINRARVPDVARVLSAAERP